MHMENNIETPLSIDLLAANTHISCRQLERLFKSNFNETPTNFYLGLRLNRAQNLLRETDLSITEVSIATGFDLVSYFSRAYRNLFKQTPKSERKGSSVQLFRFSVRRLPEAARRPCVRHRQSAG